MACRGDKTEAVKKALGWGLKRKGGLTQPSAARQSGQEEPGEGQGAPPAVRPTATPPPGELTPQDLGALADSAERAGGVGRLQEFLVVLKRIR